MAKLIRGRYEPLEVVGRGGQGKVIKALDRVHGRNVALKMRTAATAETREALLGEARILLGLKPHPGLPLVREDFFVGRNYYLAMDWVEGRNLQQVLAEEGDPGLPLGTVLRYLTQVADTLDRLHGNEPALVHQDVKPANLILTPTGRVVVVDFGIAGLKGRAGHRGGTYGYEAPEVGAGRAPTPAMDIYSLAATAFSLLTGGPPMPGSTPDAIPAGAYDVIRRGLSSDPSRRPASASGFVQELQSWLEPSADTHEVASTPEPTPPQRPSPVWSRSRVLAATFALVAIGGSVPVVVGLRSSQQTGGRLGSGSSATPDGSPSSRLSSSASPASSGLAGSPRPGSTTTASQPPGTTGPAVALSYPQEGQYTYLVDSTETREGGEPVAREDVETIVSVERRSTPAPEFSFSMSFTGPADSFPPHQEVMWLAYGKRGVSITHERLDVRGCDALHPFDVCVASEADYAPGMMLVPYPSSPGYAWSGTSKGRDPGDPDPKREDGYRGTVLRWERLVVAGAAIDTLVVEWTSEFAGKENGTRNRKIWFSPVLGVAVKWEDRLSWRRTDGSWYRSTSEWVLRARPG